jgi:hypothetical protein
VSNRFPFIGNLCSRVSVGGKEVKEDIDEKEKIDDIDNSRAEPVGLMPKGDLERNETAAYQD